MMYTAHWRIYRSRHCEEQSDEAIQILARASGLLRGVYHRAGHFGPDPLARNDEFYRSATSKITISLTCSTAPSTSPVWPPICSIVSQAKSATATASTTSAISACASPRHNSSAKNPSAAAIATL